MIRLGLKLGRLPGEFLPLMTVPELVEMMAFDRIEPIGTLPALHAAGTISATVANVNRDPKNSDGFTAEDFVPFLRTPKERSVRGESLTPEELSALLDAELFGRTVH